MPQLRGDSVLERNRCQRACTLLACRLQHKKTSVRAQGTPEHPTWRVLRWLLVALAAWWLLWTLLRGAPV
jgi:hypothetical protein